MLFRAVLKDKRREIAGDTEKQRKDVEQKRDAVNEKLYRCDEMWLEGSIEPDARERLRSRLIPELQRYESDLRQLEADSVLDFDGLAEGLDLLSILPQVWQSLHERGDADGIHALWGSIMPEKSVVEDGVVRTPWGAAIIQLGQKPRTPPHQLRRRPGWYRVRDLNPCYRRERAAS